MASEDVIAVPDPAPTASAHLASHDGNGRGRHAVAPAQIGHRAGAAGQLCIDVSGPGGRGADAVRFPAELGRHENDRGAMRGSCALSTEV